MIKLKYLADEKRVIKLEGADYLAPFVVRAQAAENGAESARDVAVSAKDVVVAAKAETQGLRDSAQAAARYFPTQASGEAGSSNGQFFSMPDGAGGLVYRQRTSGGSTIIGQMLTPARLAQEDGAGLIVRKAYGTGAIVRTVDAALSEATRGSVGDYLTAGSPDLFVGIAASFNAQSGTRPFAFPTGNPAYPVGYSGIGRLPMAKGRFPCTPVSFSQSQLGMEVSGHGATATTLAFNLTGAQVAWKQSGYVNVRLRDFTIQNTRGGPYTTDNPEQTVGIELNGGNGGAGMMAIERLTFEGVGTSIAVTGQVDGDKTLYSGVHFGFGPFGWSSVNPQAIGHTFINCAFGNTEAHILYGGSGETRVTAATGNIGNSALRITEGAGNETSGRVVLDGCAYEMHGSGDRLVLDARTAKLSKSAGGAAVTVYLRETRTDGGEVQDWTTRTVVQVGEGDVGSDSVCVDAEGGRMPGLLRIGSSTLGANNNRWRFANMEAGPDPQKSVLSGAGNHALLEFRHIRNVPLDQYIGGQAFTGSLDASEKPYLCAAPGVTNPRHLFSSVNGEAFTGGAIAAAQTRYGLKFELSGFPALCSWTGLGVFITSNTSGSDTLIEWFADSALSTLLGSVVVPGSRLGLSRVKMLPDAVPPNGSKIWGRMSKASMGQNVFGRLVPFYFPYMG